MVHVISSALHAIAPPPAADARQARRCRHADNAHAQSVQVAGAPSRLPP